jgi:hypothetical protein
MEDPPSREDLMIGNCIRDAIDRAEARRKTDPDRQGEHRISVPWLADRLGLTPKAIYKWINGQTHVTVDNMIKVAKLLGISTIDLIPEELQILDPQVCRAIAILGFLPEGEWRRSLVDQMEAGAQIVGRALGQPPPKKP